uniref:Uncharacterized protein n=1 Tax=Micrurus corallinus TaxID=54390 RepID=A0A2D4FG24_MICCO
MSCYMKSMAFWISSGGREPQHYNTTNPLLKAGQTKNGRKIQNHPESVLHFLSIGDFFKKCVNFGTMILPYPPQVTGAKKTNKPKTPSFLSHQKGPSEIVVEARSNSINQKEGLMTNPLGTREALLPSFQIM